MSDTTPTQPPAQTPPAGWQYTPPYRAEDPRKVSVPLATLLSLMPGLGQVYLGYYASGFRNILVVASVIALLNQGSGPFEPFLGLFLAFFWLFNLVDASRTAHLWNQALVASPTLEVPVLKQDRFSPLLAGVGLTLVGLVTLVHRVLDIPMAWLGRWWPAALVVAGIVLIWQSVKQDASKTEEA